MRPSAGRRMVESGEQVPHLTREIPVLSIKDAAKRPCDRLLPLGIGPSEVLKLNLHDRLDFV